jgi:hypothetical protein
LTNKSCVHSKVGISLQDTNGVLFPCCKYNDSGNKNRLPTIYDIDSLDSLHHRSEYSNLRAEIENDLKPSPCNRCWKMEENGLRSKRQDTNHIYDRMGIEDGYIQDMEIALDFTCNMMCRICGPHSSSKWGAATTVLEKLMERGIDNGNHMDRGTLEYQSNFKRVMDNTDLSKARVIKVLGGEPFYSKNLAWFVDKLHDEIDDSSKLNLNIFTNNSIFPSDQMLKKLLRFKSLTITSSIDAVGDLASVIRWGIPWSTIESNCKRWGELQRECDNLSLITCSTISLLNVNKVQDLLDFGNRYEFWIGLSYLDTPSYLSAHMVPRDIRERWILPHTSNGKWKEQVDMHNEFLLSDIVDANLFGKFIESVQILDAYQKCDFKMVNREMYDLAVEMSA